MLERFKAYLKGLGTLGGRSIQNHMVAIRSVGSQAKKDNLIDEKHYPFGKGKMKIKFRETSKLGLNNQEIESLETTSLDAKADNCRNLWLMSYYFAGVRISDVMRLACLTLRMAGYIISWERMIKVTRLRYRIRPSELLRNIEPASRVKMILSSLN
jgi:hypothetical protein